MQYTATDLSFVKPIVINGKEIDFEMNSGAAYLLSNRLNYFLIKIFLKEILSMRMW